MIKISGLDHLVLTVSDLQASCDFYRSVLGMEVVTFAEGRKALRFGMQKINTCLMRIDPYRVQPTCAC
jgi:catechol 2,3-dioxygenase-like lactoylglutathione lyase family enzyme